MIRALTLAASVLAFSLPAMAEEAATATDAAQNATIRSQLTYTSAALGARQHLAKQGYVNISDLDKDANGRWFGTAQKDGKAVYVAIRLPIVNGEQDATN